MRIIKDPSRRPIAIVIATVAVLLLVELFSYGWSLVNYRLEGLGVQHLELSKGVLTDFRREQGVLVAESDDPNMTFTKVRTRVAQILIQCRNSLPGGVGQVFYRSGNGAFVEADSVRYTTYAGANTVLLPLPGLQSVKALRFDLTNTPGDRVFCDEIVLNPHPVWHLTFFRGSIYACLLLVEAFILSGIWRRRSVQRFFVPVYRQGLAVALLSMILVFPDVLFLGTSLRITDLWNGAINGLPPTVFYPQPFHRQWADGESDSGGAQYESEPMMQFMLRTLRSGESPYWNPYSAAGSLGPETLVDNKFSLLTLLYAVLGGGSLVYNVVMLLLLFWAAFFTYCLVRERLGLSPLAGLASTLLYLLNGYATANLGSNVAQSYLYVPMCLYVSMGFIGKPTVRGAVESVLAFAALFSCTFVPTTLTNVVAMYAILLGYALSRQSRFRDGWKGMVRVLGLHVGLMAAAVLLLAFIYLPILENLGSTGTLTTYAVNPLVPTSALLIPSVFTSSHFFESYNAMDPAVFAYVRYPLHNTVAFHFGAISLTLALCSFSLKRRRLLPLVLLGGLAILIGLGAAFGLPGIFQLVSHLPLVSAFSNQYWWPLIVVPMIPCVGIGVDNLRHRAGVPWLGFVLLAILLTSLGMAGSLYGLRGPNPVYVELSVILVIAFALIASASAYLVKYVSTSKARNAIAAGLVVLVFVELTVDSKTMRFQRNDLFASPPAEIPFLQEQAGLSRTLTFFQDIGVRPELGSAFGIQEATAIDQGTFPAYISYFHAMISLDPDQRLFYNNYPSLRTIRDTPGLDAIDWPLVDLLGVKYVITPRSFVNFHRSLLRQGLLQVLETPRVYVYENPDVLPRAFTVDLASVGQGPSVTLASNASTDLQPADIISYRNAAVQIVGQVDKGALLVLTDNWHPDWTAYVNGVQTPILRVNGTFRGIRLAPGQYDVRMLYRPRTLLWAMALTCATSLLLIGLLLNGRRLDPFLANLMGDQASLDRRVQHPGSETHE